MKKEEEEFIRKFIESLSIDDVQEKFDAFKKTFKKDKKVVEPEQQCSGTIIKDGSRCKSKKLDGGELCSVHKKASETNKPIKKKTIKTKPKSKIDILNEMIEEVEKMSIN
jgi:hypothetical protein